MDHATLLDEAVARVRTLPASEQELAAEMIFAVVHRNDPQPTLTADQVDEVRRIRAGLRDGSVALATEEEVAEMWRSFGR